MVAAITVIIIDINTPLFLLFLTQGSRTLLVYGVLSFCRFTDIPKDIFISNVSAGRGEILNKIVI